jgi:hypothetical protein
MSHAKIDQIVLTIPDWVVVGLGIWVILYCISTSLSIYRKYLQGKLLKQQAIRDMHKDTVKLYELKPMRKPDGTFCNTKHAWVKWAKKELGYK